MSYDDGYLMGAIHGAVVTCLVFRLLFRWMRHRERRADARERLDRLAVR